MKSKKDVKTMAVKATNNFVNTHNDDKPVVAPARRGFKPSTSTQMEQKNKYSSMCGYSNDNCGNVKHTSISGQFGTAPKKMSAVGEKISDGTSAPMAKRNSGLYAKSAGKSASGKVCNGTC